MAVNSGWIKYHKGPRTVCLYTVTMLLFTNSSSKSLYLQISLKLRSMNFRFGEISYNQSFWGFALLKILSDFATKLNVITK